MARPIKQGIDYFSIQCYPDDNFKFVEAQHGLVGFAVVAKLWLRIYSINGYWCEWTRKSEVIFAKEIGVPVSEVQDIVQTCFEEKIFHQGMYDKYEILTSSGCQKYWQHVVTNAKRKFTEIDPKYSLLKTPEETGLTPEETPNTLEEKAGKKESLKNRGKYLKNEFPLEETPNTLEETELTQGESTRSRSRSRIRSNTVTNTPKDKLSCCYAEKSELKTAAAAAIRNYDGTLPDDIVELLSNDLATKFLGQNINDLQALCNGFVKNFKPPVSKLKKHGVGQSIEINGRKHEPVMNGNGWAWPTIRGTKFAEDFSQVLLTDETWMVLDKKNAELAKLGSIDPKDVYKKAN